MLAVLELNPVEVCFLPPKPTRSKRYKPNATSIRGNHCYVKSATQIQNALSCLQKRRPEKLFYWSIYNVDALTAIIWTVSKWKA